MALLDKVHDFPTPSEVHAFAGILFDMDGTLIDSTEAIIKHWHGIGTELNVDPNVILATSHGRRSIDILKIYDPQKATSERKPDPACYLLGRSRLGLPPDSSVLVIEDAPAGIRAGKAAGCKVIGLTTTHSMDQVKEAGADLIVPSLKNVTFQGWDEETGKAKVEISDGVRL
ncbi:MAG: hypothetical protein M1827_006447 [Pycnora praestabilis]|nr:MAG: hypothetical protein M1827_006447 [Pycnora praestabilis]